MRLPARTISRLEQLEEAEQTYILARATMAICVLNPEWDPLRGDPRFEKLVEESKKPVALESPRPLPGRDCRAAV